MNIRLLKQSLLCVVGLVILSLSAALWAKDVQMVRYLGNNTASVSESYYLSIIDRALKVTEGDYGPYEVVFTQEEVTAERKHELLVVGNKVNIDRLVGFPSSRGARKGLIRIEAPLLNGFMGFRVPLIRSENQEFFKHITQLDELRGVPLGLGKGWEGNVYRANGFLLSEPINMTMLLKMLAGQRYVYVPLSAIEIEDNYEIDGRYVPELVPDTSMLIYMPLPVYFYVSPKEKKLAERLNKGLKQMMADGSHDEIFNMHFGARLKRLHLADRHLIKIPNPEDDGSLGEPDFEKLKDY
jgi:hypothetical protein